MAETWSSIADWYAALLRQGSAMHEFSRDILLSVVPLELNGNRVLDVGCGEGLQPGHWRLAAASTRPLTDRARRPFRREDDGRSLCTVAGELMDWVTGPARCPHTAPCPNTRAKG